MKTKVFRYKGNKSTEFGISNVFYKTLISGSWWGNRKMKLPKPYNNAEIAILSKFIFGVELSVSIQVNDYLNRHIKEDRDIKFIRFLKLYKLNPIEDYIKKSSLPKYISCDDDKMILLSIRYQCSKKHNDYYDGGFNMNVLNSPYEVDAYFWDHCVGRLHCGVIGGESYGQVNITSFKEYERILNICNNPEEPARESFKKEINKLIKKDNKYFNESMQVQV
jgi:hypothetical protein